MKKIFGLAAILLLLWTQPLWALTVNLTWQDNSNNEDGFGIQAAPSCAGTFADIGKVGANVTTFSDPNATPGKCYRVYAFNMAGSSGFSNTAFVPDLPNDPSNLRLSFNTPTSLSAEWNDNTTGEIGFRLTTVAQRPPLRTLFDYPSANVTRWIVTGLNRNRLYCATIVALLPDGSESGKSNEACAST